MVRTILHCDMNNFFASVECRKDPRLFDLPVAVCGSVEERHGIVLAKNYVAKKYGIVTGEPVFSAKNKCPDLITVEPHYDDYTYFSGLAKEIYLSYTDLVEPFGADECWLDVTGSYALFGDGKTIANELRERIKRELGLTISVGVSFNKTFAKLGSDMKKPDAVTVIPKDSFREKIWSLPANELIGIGPSTTATLARFGVHTIGQLANAYPPMLKSALGKNGLKLIEIANGRDESPVVSEENAAPIKSISHGTTTVRDLETHDDIKTVMLALCEELGHRLLSLKRKARTVSISLRDNQLVTRQYQCHLDMPTDSYSVIAKRAFSLMCEKHVLSAPLRSVTVGVNDLIPSSSPCQVDFFTDTSDTIRRETLDSVMDMINVRFGREKIRYGLLYSSPLSDVGEGFGFGMVSRKAAEARERPWSSPRG